MKTIQQVHEEHAEALVRLEKKYKEDIRVATEEKLIYDKTGIESTGGYGHNTYIASATREQLAKALEVFPTDGTTQINQSGKKFVYQISVFYKNRSKEKNKHRIGITWKSEGMILTLDTDVGAYPEIRRLHKLNTRLMTSYEYESVYGNRNHPIPKVPRAEWDMFIKHQTYYEDQGCVVLDDDVIDKVVSILKIPVALDITFTMCYDSDKKKYVPQEEDFN
jgi:hypothetical protein